MLACETLQVRVFSRQVGRPLQQYSTAEGRAGQPTEPCTALHTQSWLQRFTLKSCCCLYNKLRSNNNNNIVLLHLPPHTTTTTTTTSVFTAAQASPHYNLHAGSWPQVILSLGSLTLQVLPCVLALYYMSCSRGRQRKNWWRRACRDKRMKMESVWITCIRQRRCREMELFYIFLFFKMSHEEIIEKTFKRNLWRRDCGDTD